MTLDLFVRQLQPGDRLVRGRRIVSIHRSSLPGKTIVVVMNKWGQSHAATWCSRTPIRVERDPVTPFVDESEPIGSWL